MIAAMVCVTAVACVLLLRVERAPAQQRFQLYSIDETSPANGKTVKSVYRFDRVTGKAWRISSRPFEVSRDAQHDPMVNWADGWEEMPESPEAAVAKEQAEIKTILQKP
jgi:hypothetical protein